MAKIFKQLVFGQKKSPPVPPRPDYGGDGASNSKFSDHLYANIRQPVGAKVAITFQEKKENKLVVFQEYSEPADLRSEIDALKEVEDADPLYMSPVDQADGRLTCYNVQEEEPEEMYSVPYEEDDDTSAPPLPPPCLPVGSYKNRGDYSVDSSSSCYETVNDLNHDSRNGIPAAASSAGGQITLRPCEDYDEPWEWNPGTCISNSSLQVSPSSPGVLSLDAEEHTYSEPAAESVISDSESYVEDEDEMTARQRRLYETAFDSRVKRDMDDIDRLMQSPVLRGELFRSRMNPGDPGHVVRTASRSSFGSTSGSSNSSTPTHQPLVISKPSPRPRHHPLHYTPTERRKVRLIRDLPRSSSPHQPIKVIASVEPLPKGFVEFNRNSARTDNLLITSYERKLARSSLWDNASRCSDKSSSSQESMDQKDDFRLLSNCREEPRLYPLGKSASRDSINFREESKNLSNYANDLANLKINGSGVVNKNSSQVISGKLNKCENSAFATKEIGGHSVIKVLPTTDNGRLVTKPKSNKVTPARETNQRTLMSDNAVSSCEDSSTYNNANNEEPRKFVRPNSLAADSSSRSDSGVRQSPENDDRPSDDYDPPWEFKPCVLRPSVNGSFSVPESLSCPPADEPSTSKTDSREKDVERANQNKLSCITKNPEEKSQSVAEAKPASSKLSGPPARPSLNLNLNLNSDSPKKARQNLILNFGCAALSAVGEKVDADLTLEKQGWYHGSISRQDAENLLRVLKEGSYLVRNSESSKQDYSLSLRSARGFMHMKIVHTDGHFILGQFSNPFSSIPEMIHHYSINKLPIKGAEHMSLLYPVIDQLL